MMHLNFFSRTVKLQNDTKWQPIPASSMGIYSHHKQSKLSTVSSRHKTNKVRRRQVMWELKWCSVPDCLYDREVMLESEGEEQDGQKGTDVQKYGTCSYVLLRWHVSPEAAACKWTTYLTLPCTTALTTYQQTIHACSCHWTFSN